jgi:hypothetical protein
MDVQMPCLLVNPPYIGIPYFVDPERIPITYRNEKSFLFHHVANTQGKEQTLLMEAMLRQQTEYFNLKITLAIQAS